MLVFLLLISNILNLFLFNAWFISNAVMHFLITSLKVLPFLAFWTIIWESEWFLSFINFLFDFGHNLVVLVHIYCFVVFFSLYRLKLLVFMPILDRRVFFILGKHGKLLFRFILVLGFNFFDLEILNFLFVRLFLNLLKLILWLATPFAFGLCRACSIFISTFSGFSFSWLFDWFSFHCRFSSRSFLWRSFLSLWFWSFLAWWRFPWARLKLFLFFLVSTFMLWVLRLLLIHWKRSLFFNDFKRAVNFWSILVLPLNLSKLKRAH